MSDTTSEYTKEELEGLHRISLQMAKVFVEFCRENNLTCYFCGGGCIGAIRHKGFIPWDDDLDFFMPREDYEVFVKKWNSYEPGKRYVLSDTTMDYIDRNNFATLRDSETTQIKPYQKDLRIAHGVALDVIPLDGYPEGKWKRKIQCMWALIYQLFRAQTVPEKHGGLMAAGSRFLLSVFRGKKIRYKIWNLAKKRMTKYPISECNYITELCSGPFYMKKKYKKEWFEKAVFVPFEEENMPIPVGYDGYLKEAFGDYMALPPKEKQKAHHDCVLLDLNRPCVPATGERLQAELRKLQKKCLEITLVFKEFCEKHDLLFYFCGGCCIGTLRHQGFIPWDDDIDVFMPRNDYEKLCELWPKEMDETKYRLSRTSKEQFLRSQLTMITDEETTFVKERQMDLDIAHGIRLEILPLDGCPSSRFKRKMQLLWGLAYQIYINQEAPTSKGKGFYLIGKGMLLFAPGWKNRYRMACLCERHMSKYPIEECDYITELCVRYNYMVNEYPKEIFASAVYKEFEGEQMPIPVGYDTYLKMAFGDYMTMPPKENQVPSHDGIVVDTEKAYSQYKGVYYPLKRAEEDI